MKKRIAELLTVIMFFFLISDGCTVSVNAEEITDVDDVQVEESVETDDVQVEETTESDTEKEEIIDSNKEESENLTEIDNVKATGVTLFDAADMSTFSERTRQSVADEYIKAVYAGSSFRRKESSTWYTSEPSFATPYSTGTLTRDTLETMTAYTNYFRWLCGIKPLTSVPANSDTLQAEAFIRNYYHGHMVPDSEKPADMPDDIWTLGQSNTHRILAWYCTPFSAIQNWMNEGYSHSYGWDHSNLGHRMELLSPSASEIQFGFSGDVAVGRDSAYRTGDRGWKEAFFSFPSPGPMPSNIISPYVAAWDVGLNYDYVKFENKSDVTVTVKNNRTNESYECTEENGKLNITFGDVAFAQPSDYSDKGYVDSYSIEVTGLKDLNNNPAVIRYTVDFFDPYDYVPASITTVNTEFITSERYYVNKSLNNEESLNKIATYFPNDFSVSVDNGESFRLNVTGPWKVDMSKQCFYNSLDVSGTEGRAVDRYHVVDRVEFPYTITDENINLSISPNVVNAGDDVDFTVKGQNDIECNKKVYKLTQKSDGSYSSDIYCYISSVDTRTKYNVTSDYNGEYFAAEFRYFDNDDEFYIDVIFAENFATLKVNGDSSIKTSGIYCVSTSPSIVAGLVVDNKSNISEDIEYQWLVCDESTGAWSVASDWTVNNEWMNYTPPKSGNYVFVCKARIVGGDSEPVVASFGTPFTKTGGIKQICQMPYWGEGGGYLIGFESFENPNQEYQYEMFVMDLSLLAAGSPTPWVHATGKIKLTAGATPEDGKTMWTIWQPEYGYYLTLFRLYDKDGNMIDEVPYGFANAY